jgi:hypothetical protein
MSNARVALRDAAASSRARLGGPFLFSSLDRWSIVSTETLP